MVCAVYSRPKRVYCSTMMFVLSLILCAALARPATIIGHSSQSAADVHILQSAYSNANLVGSGHINLNASTVSVPSVSSAVTQSALPGPVRNASLAKLDFGAIICTDTRLGQPYYPSCVEALHLMPTDNRVIQYTLSVFSPRGPDVRSSPHRVLSCQ